MGHEVEERGQGDLSLSAFNVAFHKTSEDTPVRQGLAFVFAFLGNTS